MLKIDSTRHPRVRWLPVASVAALLAMNVQSVSPAFAQQTQTTTVVLTELQFSPKTISLTLGQPVQLTIQNSGKANHNLSSRDSADSILVSNVTYRKADNDPRQLREYGADNILDTDGGSGHTPL